MELAAAGSTNAKAAGASSSRWPDWEALGAGTAGAGCGWGAVLFMQQLALPQ